MGNITGIRLGLEKRVPGWPADLALTEIMSLPVMRDEKSFEQLLTGQVHQLKQFTDAGTQPATLGELSRACENVGRVFAAVFWERWSTCMSGVLNFVRGETVPNMPTAYFVAYVEAAWRTFNEKVRKPYVYRGEPESPETLFSVLDTQKLWDVGMADAVRASRNVDSRLSWFSEFGTAVTSLRTLQDVDKAASGLFTPTRNQGGKTGGDGHKNGVGKATVLEARKAKRDASRKRKRDEKEGTGSSSPVHAGGGNKSGTVPGRRENVPGDPKVPKLMPHYCQAHLLKLSGRGEGCQRPRCYFLHPTTKADVVRDKFEDFIKARGSALGSDVTEAVRRWYGMDAGGQGRDV